MRTMFVTVLFGAAITACSSEPSQTPSPTDVTAESRLDPAAAAGQKSFGDLGDVGVLLAPPNFTPGSCLFVPDGSLAGFIRTGPDGKEYLKVNDHAGTVIVTPLGGETWVGTGRATIDWPNYKGDPADNVNMMVDGNVSSNGQTAKASCHYLVAHGKKIQAVLSIH
jgi:hypothetical protein